MSALRASSRTRPAAGASPIPGCGRAIASTSAPSSRSTMLKVRLVRSRGGGIGIDRRGRDAAAACSAQIEEYFIEGLVVGDTFVFGGEVVRYEALAGRPGLCLARQRQGCKGAVLYGRQVSALDLPRRTRPQFARRQARLEGAARSGARLAVAAGAFVARARRARTGGGNLSARRQALPRLLPVRGPAGAPDARHAA